MSRRCRPSEFVLLCLLAVAIALGFTFVCWVVQQRYFPVQKIFPQKIFPKAQQGTPWEQAPLPLPPLDLDLAEIVDILTEYKIVHDKHGVLRYFSYYGVTDTDTKTIYISDEGDLGTNRDTVIHELLHIMYWRRGIATGGTSGYEPYIYQRAHEIVLKFYGPPGFCKDPDGMWKPRSQSVCGGN